jgi:hypothetical protein
MANNDKNNGREDTIDTGELETGLGEGTSWLIVSATRLIALLATRHGPEGVNLDSIHQSELLFF